MIGTSVLSCNDMFDVKDLIVVVVLMKSTILAPSGRAFPDDRPSRIVHHSPREAASSCRAFDFKIATKVAYDT